MTTYLVRLSGNDSTGDGLTPSTAWRTIGKALTSMASGDITYVGGGAFRETISVGMTSATAETKVIGDVDGAKTGDPGEVILTAYTTDDLTTPATSSALSLNGCDFLTFQNIRFVGGNLANGACVVSSTSAGAAHSTNIKFIGCSFESGLAGGTNASLVYLGNGAQESSIWTFDRCLFFSINQAGLLLWATQFATGADWDEQIVLTNCAIFGPSGNLVWVTVNGSANTHKPGGIKLKNCASFTNSSIFNTSANAHSTTVASDIEHCLIYSGSSSPITAATSGMLVREDYNRIYSPTAVSANVTSGGHSDTYINSAIVKHGLFDFGQAALWGFQPRPQGTPSVGSNLLGAATGGNITALTVDFLNRPRPAGGQITNAVGALERHDTFVQVASPVHGSAGHSWQCVGPGDHDFALPVDAAAQTPSVWVQFDSSYGAGTKPQLALRNGGGIGVADQTITCTASANTWQQLTLASFTPSAKGIISIRFISSAAAAGTCTFSDFQP